MYRKEQRTVTLLANRFWKTPVTVYGRLGFSVKNCEFTWNVCPWQVVGILSNQEKDQCRVHKP